MTYRRSPSFYASTATDGTATVVRVFLTTDEFEFKGAGSSRRMSGDANDPELGELLALKRALSSMLESIDAKTAKLIRVNDKKAAEAANYKTKEQWEAEQRAASMKAHPAGKAKLRSVK